ncbi:MAG: LytTR family transcriptional regulator [Bacteroidota bacterium]|nr:LytTR family transcriptional regulator [Bacteroidota bacterium]
MKAVKSMSLPSGLPDPEYLFVTMHNTKYVLLVKDILRFEAIRIYTVIYVRNKEQYICSKHLKMVCDELQSDIFFRIHKSHVINLREVKGYQEGRGGKVIMSDNKVLDVSQRKKAAFLKKFYEMYKITPT